MEYESLTRKVIILFLLPKHPITTTAATLCDQLVSRGYSTNVRAIQRDLQDLLNISQCGLVVEESTRPFKWSISADWHKIQLTEMDNNTALAFSMLERIGHLCLPNVSLQQLKQTFTQANRVLKLSDGHTHWLESMSHKYSGHEITDDQLKLETAILQGKDVSAQVTRFIKHEQASLVYSKLSPYAFVDDAGEKYLVFRVGSDAKLNQWPVKYFSDIKLLDSMSITINTANLSHQGRRYRGETIQFECITHRQSSFINKLQAHQYAFTATATENDQVKINAQLINSGFFRELVWSHATSIKVLNPPSIKQYIYRQTQRLIALSD
jgi:hypothetical protein